jgi:nitroreductase
MPRLPQHPPTCYPSPHPSPTLSDIRKFSSAAVTSLRDPSDIVLDAIASRRSVRAFLPTPVPRATVERILEAATRAPSGTNMQPWRVRVLTGAAKERLSQAVYDAAMSEPERHKSEYLYYPPQFPEPYLSRRRKVGWDLYGLLGIAKTDKAAMHRQHARNYRFFDAPVGMMFTIDRIMGQGSWLDFGMFLQGLMVTARGLGLDTCPQAAWTPFHRIVMPAIGAPDNEQLVCGMSLGWRDPNAIENTLVTEREPVARFVRYLE